MDNNTKLETKERNVSNYEAESFKMYRHQVKPSCGCREHFFFVISMLEQQGDPQIQWNK